MLGRQLMAFGQRLPLSRNRPAATTHKGGPIRRGLPRGPGGRFHGAESFLNTGRGGAPSYSLIKPRTAWDSKQRGRCVPGLLGFHSVRPPPPAFPFRPGPHVEGMKAGKPRGRWAGAASRNGGEPLLIASPTAIPSQRAWSTQPGDIWSLYSLVPSPAPPSVC